MVRIDLLGGVRVTADDGTPIAIGAARTRIVLAALAFSPGHPVPVSRLIDLVWHDTPPGAPEKSLQWHIARLRKALGFDLITRTGAAYRLDVPPAAVDVTRFESRLRAADFPGALQQWSGTPLAGLDAPGLAPTVAGLHEQWLQAMTGDLEQRSFADPHAAIATLTELTKEHPLREDLWALLMTTLYRVGRQADALAEYRTAREHLTTQLGIEPGPALRDLEARILAHDDGLLKPVGLQSDSRTHVPEGNPHRPPPVDGPPSPGAGDGSGADGPVDLPGVSGGQVYLPGRVSRLIGRDSDLETAAAALNAARVLTLVGPGGIGKTQLALAVAARFGPRAWVVELAEIAADADVSRAVADGLGVTQRPGFSLLRSIVAVQQANSSELGYSALLVLDNCEHVLAGAAEVAQAVAAGCPGVRVLATSRERLAVADEQVMVVPPLDSAGGIELFDVRAYAADRSYDGPAWRDRVAEICRRLDGIPLAIELAAARMVSHSPADLVARLDDLLRATGTRRTGVARHRTLRAAIDWSYELLAPSERILLQELSVFAAAFDLDAVVAVAGEGDSDLALSALVERSMVAVGVGRSGRRFRLLETVREYAVEQLRGHCRFDAVAERHARWCAAQVGHIHGLLVGPAEVEGVHRLAELWPDLRAAVRWADENSHPRLADALVRPIVTELPLRGRQEIGDWAIRMVASTAQGDPETRAFWMLWVAERHVQNADPAAYAEIAARYPDLVPASSVPTRSAVSVAASGPGELETPGPALRRYADAYATDDGATLRRMLPDAAAALRSGTGDPHLADFLEINSAGTLLGLRLFAEVDASITALADRYRSAGPPSLLHWALQTLAYSAVFQGRAADSDRYFDEAAGIELPPGTLSANKTSAARSAFRRGDRARAYELLGSYIDELLTTGNVVAAAVVGIEFINMAAALDRPGPAVRVLEYLKAANDFGALAARTLVSERARLLAATAEPDLAGADPLDDRAALTFMREVLRTLS